MLLSEELLLSLLILACECPDTVISPPAVIIRINAVYQMIIVTTVILTCAVQEDVGRRIYIISSLIHDVLE